MYGKSTWMHDFKPTLICVQKFFGGSQEHHPREYFSQQFSSQMSLILTDGTVILYFQDNLISKNSSPRTILSPVNCKIKLSGKRVGLQYIL